MKGLLALCFTACQDIDKVNVSQYLGIKIAARDPGPSDTVDG